MRSVACAAAEAALHATRTTTSPRARRAQPRPDTGEAPETLVGWRLRSDAMRDDRIAAAARRGVRPSNRVAWNLASDRIRPENGENALHDRAYAPRPLSARKRRASIEYGGRGGDAHS